MSINRTNFLASVIVLVASSGVSANCFRIDGSTNPAPSSNTYLEPGMGNRVAWTGSTDSTGYVSGVSVPNTINLNSSAFQPDGTILASGIQTIYAATGNILDPESVLFRCQPGDENSLYEYFSTNGDDARRGMIEIGTAAGLGEGIYRTEAQDIGLRITNLTTMQTLSRYYKGRQLTGLDKDSQGWTLVKAKNFSTQFKVDYIKVAGSIGHTGDFHYYIAPSGYLTFVGPGIPSNYTEGSDAAAKYLGHFAYWPASLANGWGIKVRRAATCAVTNVTPTVTFPPISVEELESGGVRQVPIDIRFDCQTGAPASTGLIKFVSGTSLNQTAMGILVQPANAAAAQAEGLATGGGVQYLLSDGYGVNASVAKGVGIEISRQNGEPLKLLGSELIVGGGRAAGWYPVLEDSTSNGTANGVTNYSKQLSATLKALPNKTPTAGRVAATAQVIIKVQ